MSEQVARVPISVLLIVATALLIRVALIAMTHDYVPLNDGATYDRHARALAAGQGYPPSAFVPGGGPSAHTPPGYPMLLAAVHSVTGDSWTAGRLAQALLGTLAVGLIGVIARQLWGARAAIASMGLAAVSPFLLFPNAALISEPLFVVLVLGALAAVLEHRHHPQTYRWIIAAGVLAGLACVTRTNGFVIVPALAAGVWCGSWRFAALWRPACLIATAALVLAPWTIRNTIATDHFVLVSTRTGFALQRTYNTDAEHDPALPSTPHISAIGHRIYSEPGITEAEADEKLRAAALKYMREHPQYVLKTVVRNALRAFHLQDVELTRASFNEVGSGLPSWLGGASVRSFYVVGALALVAAFLLPARRAPAFVWAVPFFLFVSILLTAAGRVRYRAPVDPFLVMLAGLAIVAMVDRVRAPR